VGYPRGVLELWFDFSCPYAYLASRKAPAIARAAGVEVDWRPMLLGGVFRGIDPSPRAKDGPMVSLGPAKARHNHADMHRWAELLGVPFRVPPTHPMRTVRALRVLLALPHSRWPQAIEALYAAYWQRGEDVSKDDVIVAALEAAPGVPNADITSAIARADDPAIKDELRRRTDEAIALGIFGAPAWVMRRSGAAPLLLWGQDRIPWVEAALAGWDPDAGPPPGGPRPFGRDVQGFTSSRSLALTFDVSSPFAYLALTQVPELARATGVTPTLHPILLGGLFRDIGQVDVPLFSMPAPKLRYLSLEMQRWARWWGVPFDPPRKFPQRTIAAQRLCLIATTSAEPAAALRLATSLGRAMWAEQKDLEDPDTLRGILDDVGLPRAWLERTQDPAIKQALAAETAAAAAAGVFGVPTWIVGGTQLVWGQDRIEIVLRMLGGWDAPS
jgi:2-hydroxychromene-2-carboxylate isomerase